MWPSMIKLRLEGFKNPFFIVLLLWLIGLSLFLITSLGLVISNNGNVYELSLTLGADTFYLIYIYSPGDVFRITEPLFKDFLNLCNDVRDYGILYTRINASIYNILSQSSVEYSSVFIADTVPTIDLSKCIYFYRNGPLEASVYIKTITDTINVLKISITPSLNTIFMILVTSFLTSLFVFILVIYIEKHIYSLFRNGIYKKRNHISSLLSVLLAYITLLYMLIFVEYIIKRGSVGNSLIFVQLLSYTLLVSIFTFILKIANNDLIKKVLDNENNYKRKNNSTSDYSKGHIINSGIYMLGILGFVLSFFLFIVLLLNGREFLRGLMFRYLYLQGSIEIFTTLLLVIPLMVLNLMNNMRLTVAYFYTMIILLISTNVVFLSTYVLNSKTFFQIIPPIFGFASTMTISILFLTNFWLLGYVVKSFIESEKELLD